MQTTARDRSAIRGIEFAAAMTRRLASIVICSTATALCAEERPVAEANRGLVAAGLKAATERWLEGKTIVAATELEKRIYAAFEQPLTETFAGIPLRDLAALLEKKLSCTVLLDVAALEADGILPGQPLEIRARGRTLRTELRALLEPHRLVAVVRDECLLITTKTAAETMSSVRIYQVHDLIVQANDPTASIVDFERLSHLLSAQCRLESRNEIRFFEVRTPGVLGLALNEPDDIHERVEDLLAQLRAARVEELRRLQEKAPHRPLRHEPALSEQQSSPLPPPPPLPRGKVLFRQTEKEQRIRRRLLDEAKFEFEKTPLKKVCAEIEAKHDVIVELDLAALTADGKGPESEIRFHWRAGSLRSALRMLLDAQGLAYVIHNDAILITAKTASEMIDERHVYQVHDLIPYDWANSGSRADMTGYSELITGLIAPESWSEGNRSRVDAIGFEAGGLQVVSIRQTQAVHDEIEKFFALMREAYEPRVYEVLSRRPIIVAPPEQLQQPATRGMGGGF